MSSIPGAAAVRDAEKLLQAQGRACSRRTWVCGNPHSGMYERQIVSHARRHAEIEALNDAQLRHAYVVSEIVVSEFDNRIASAELRRRNTDPVTIERPRSQCWA